MPLSLLVTQSMIIIQRCEVCIKIANKLSPQKDLWGERASTRNSLLVFNMLNTWLFYGKLFLTTSGRHELPSTGSGIDVMADINATGKTVLSCSPYGGRTTDPINSLWLSNMFLGHYGRVRCLLSKSILISKWLAICVEQNGFYTTSVYNISSVNYLNNMRSTVS